MKKDTVNMGMLVTIGEAMYLLRLRSGATLEELAARAKIPELKVAQIENDDYDKFKMSHLTLVQEALGVQAGYRLISGADKDEIYVPDLTKEKEQGDE